MALKSPLMPSPSGPSSAFSPFQDSPSSPVPFQSITNSSQPRSSTGASDSLLPPPSPYPQYIDPSPVDSNGTASTEATEIEDDGGPSEEVVENDIAVESPRMDSGSPLSPESLLGKIDTELAARTRADSDTAPQSVIHAPQDFKQFDSQTTSPQERPSSSSSPYQSSTNTILSPQSPRRGDDSEDKPLASPINTDVPRESQVMPTPKAQTRQELEDEWKRRSRHSMNLEGIPEGQDIDRHEEDDQAQEKQELLSEENGDSSTGAEIPMERIQHVNALKDGLSQCWTLCNTLANLSSNHRNQIFSYRGKSEVQEQAWRSCWKLCQNLYESRDEDHQSHVLPTLEMCRDFCQALFEARQKPDEVSDSVLRVSFELNNHLYNTHDRNLPSAFQERTLDFYLTLCHRLMKQRTSLPHETDTLLRACWSLAEMLFSLRQNNREGKPSDEELLGSAVQACWDLCDLFREGWTQVRPDRGTPRPSQSTFSPSQMPPLFRNPSDFSDHSSNPALSHSTPSYHSMKDTFIGPTTMPPETPTTVFDDTNEAVDDDDVNRPHILVLGPESSNNRWSSNSSNYSESSQRTSSTATVSSSANLNRIRILLVKSAFNCGFQPRSPPPPSNGTSSASTTQYTQSQNQALLAFVKSLPSNSFGGQAWQTGLLEKYRRFVAAWPKLMRTSRGAGIANGSLIQSVQTRASGAEVSRAVLWMMRSEQYTWLRDLFRVAFGCFPDDAITMTSVFLQG